MALRVPLRAFLIPLGVLALLGPLVVLIQSEALIDSTRVPKHSAVVSALRAETGANPAEALIQSTIEAPVPAPLPSRPPFRRFERDYDCLGWRATTNCTPDGARDPTGDAACDVKIPGGRSGYCLYRDRVSNSTMRVLPMHCDSLKQGVLFDCAYAADLIDYGRKTLGYQHDDSISTQAQAKAENNETDLSAVSFERGIAMVVHTDILASAYASIRYLRELGTKLPIEVWYKPDEVSQDHPLVQDLVANYGVLVRTIVDPFATSFYTKLYAVFHSAFDNVLLLDADNFAVRDPTFLFDSAEFVANGAMFWPDYWHPTHTIFDVRNTSVLWQILDLPFVDMFEQESGQVLIDRQRHRDALHVLMYYGFSLPRVLEELVWGDKDLFRLAWLKTNSSFFMIPTPPASAGILRPSTNQFCGLTMVQHDPHGKILFLHHNSLKLRVDTLNPRIWTHILRFKPGTPRDKYVIQWSSVFLDIPSCWGRTEDVAKLQDFTLAPIDAFPFGDIESRLFEVVNEAGSVIYHGQRAAS